VVPVVERAVPRALLDRVELEHAHALLLHRGEEGARRLDRSDAVVDQVHLHALRLLGDEQVGELAPDVVVPEDVDLEIDMVLRGADRGEHRLVGRRPVLEDGQPVARDERAAGDRLLDRDVALQEVAALARALELVEDGGALRSGEPALRPRDAHRLPGLRLDRGPVRGQRAAGPDRGAGQERRAQPRGAGPARSGPHRDETAWNSRLSVTTPSRSRTRTSLGFAALATAIA
jgi:hypothetical protein